IAAIGVLELFSFLRSGPSQISFHPLLDQPPSLNLALAFGSAMTPVLFAYGGWQTSSFLGGEVRDPRKTLPRGLVFGVLGVIAVYTSVNFVYVRALSPVGLAGTTTPASVVMRGALGPRGAALIAAGIAFSAFGFLGQSILTAPRVYFAMAEDRVFFRSVAWVHPRLHRLSRPRPSLDDTPLHHRRMARGYQYLCARSSALLHRSGHRPCRFARILFLARQIPGDLCRMTTTVPARTKRSLYMEWA